MGGLVKVDLGHGRGWASPDAAASIRRIDQQLGRPADINEAGRSPEKADNNYRKWVAYNNGTGPWAPYALPASKSVHCTGNAADSDDWYDPDAAAVWRDNGWRQTARYNDGRDEPWHGEYFQNLDNHRFDPTPTGEEEDIMNAEQEAKLDELRADLAWVKERIGGSLGTTSITDRLRALAPVVSTVQWIKERIGGSTKTAPSVADELRNARPVDEPPADA